MTVFHPQRHPKISALPRWSWLVPIFLAVPFLSGQTHINEVLYNPPNTDIPNEYIELRGTPNALLAQGTYFVAVEGDENGDPGTVQHVFDLSNQRLGGNGFLVLLQKSHDYDVQTGATVLVNTGSGSGFGSGSSSSINHEGESDQTSIENGSCTYLLIRTSTKPDIGDDIDSNDDGVPNGSIYTGWTILDSVGVLDNDGAGDRAYGAINFRRNPGASATGTVVEMAFTADYLGRSANTTGSTAGDWVASAGLGGTLPTWELGPALETQPASFSALPLNHVGGPNFGAPNLPGITISHPNGQASIAEGGSQDTYTIQLLTVPTGEVEIQLTADVQLQLSINGGSTFVGQAKIILTSTTPRSIMLRAVDDIAIEASPHIGRVTHQVTRTQDPSHYPLSLPLPDMLAGIGDNDVALLSELKVNAPGPEDHPFEFIELRGPPLAPLSNVMVLVVEGDDGADPGRANMVINLHGLVLGSNGLLLIASPGHPYSVAPGTTVLLAPQLDNPGGALENGSASYMLLASMELIREGRDLDSGDNEILEGLPSDTSILDAVGWTDGGNNDIIYGGVELSQPSGTPDVAVRFLNNNTPLSAAAWYTGNLLGTNGASLTIDPDHASPNVPPGASLTPGQLNRRPPGITTLPAHSGVIADPTNPPLKFQIDNGDVPSAEMTVTATSDNPLVVPSANLVATRGTGNQWSLALEPVGVGYATITVRAGNSQLSTLAFFPYAASAAGQPASRFHTLSTDASTAIAIPPNLMLVGDDETQVLRLYRRDLSGPPVNSYDIGPFLALTDLENGKPREVDIEGSTRVGNRIYWIGGHSHADLGEFRPNRSRIFATDLVEAGTNSTVTYVGRYEHLKDDLVVWDQSNAHGKGANYYGLAASTAEGVLPKDPYGRGFNIEGLAMAPGSSTTAWICLRAPIVPATNRLYALIVPVTNFTTLAIGNAGPGTARFGTPIHLDFQGRGFRSIERDGTGYLIITGPPGNVPTPVPPHDFKIYTWSGSPAEAPVQHATDLTDLTPEALVELPPRPWTPSTPFQIISDNGRTDFYNDGTQAKHLLEQNFKKFRSDIVTIGAEVSPEPYLTSITMQGNATILEWRSNPGDTYRIQFKQKLTDTLWTDLPGDVLATGTFSYKTNSASLPSQRFYQVMLLP